MYYAPHTLWRRADGNVGYDNDGNPIFSEGEYEQLGACRCDDANIGEMTDDNGHVYRPTYKIVIEGITGVKCGDFIQCRKGDDIRGYGKVRNIQRCNWYSYVTLWV